MTPTDLSTPTLALDEASITGYRRDGYIHIPGVLTPDEVVRYRDALKRVYDREKGLGEKDPEYSRIFKQVIQLWQVDPVLRDLTLHPGLAGLATQLAGIPLRLWHDHMLVKRPHNGAPTEFHQDSPLWPHANSRHSLSAWIALIDVPVERGCMTFLPRQQHRTDIRPANLKDKTDMFVAAPDLNFAPRVTVPLRAGDVTFHSGYTPHTANANDTDEFRWAFVVAFMDRQTTYNGAPHPITDAKTPPLGSVFTDEDFPPVPV